VNAELSRSSICSHLSQPASDNDCCDPSNDATLDGRLEDVDRQVRICLYVYTCTLHVQAELLEETRSGLDGSFDLAANAKLHRCKGPARCGSERNSINVTDTRPVIRSWGARPGS
jgi:hypothetical protein